MRLELAGEGEISPEWMKLDLAGKGEISPKWVRLELAGEAMILDMVAYFSWQEGPSSWSL